MNPLPPWHHGFFKNRIAFGQRRRQGNHVLHVHALSGKQHDFMAQVCGFEAVVRYQHTRHALPLDFSTSMATKISRKSRSKPTNGSSSKARSQPHSSWRKNATRFAMPPDNSVGYLFKSPAVSSTFAASAMISPSSGLSIKIAIFCIAVKFLGVLQISIKT